jgi:hypothetical protein
MPTPSDPTAVPEPSHDEMVRQGQNDLDEQARAVQQQRNLHDAVTQAFIPHKGVPPVSGDCVLDNEKY